MSNREISTEAIRQAIEEYLSMNPHAADTATGIASWWLSSRGTAVAQDELVPILDAMVEARVLRAATLPGGEILYERGHTPP